LTRRSRTTSPTAGASSVEKPDDSPGGHEGVEVLQVQFKQGRGAVAFDGDGDMGEMVLWFDRESFDTVRRVLEKHAGSVFVIVIPDGSES
jgi:hypothetical protein